MSLNLPVFYISVLLLEYLKKNREKLEFLDIIQQIIVNVKMNSLQNNATSHVKSNQTTYMSRVHAWCVIIALSPLTRCPPPPLSPPKNIRMCMHIVGARPSRWCQHTDDVITQIFSELRHPVIYISVGDEQRTGKERVARQQKSKDTRDDGRFRFVFVRCVHLA